MQNARRIHSPRSRSFDTLQREFNQRFWWTKQTAFLDTFGRSCCLGSCTLVKKNIIQNSTFNLAGKTHKNERFNFLRHFSFLLNFQMRNKLYLTVRKHLFKTEGKNLATWWTKESRYKTKDKIFCMKTDANARCFGQDCGLVFRRCLHFPDCSTPKLSKI